MTRPKHCVSREPSTPSHGHYFQTLSLCIFLLRCAYEHPRKRYAESTQHTEAALSVQLQSFAERSHRSLLKAASNGLPESSASYITVLQDHASGENRRGREREYISKKRPPNYRQRAIRAMGAPKPSRTAIAVCDAESRIERDDRAAMRSCI